MVAYEISSSLLGSSTGIVRRIIKKSVCRLCAQASVHKNTQKNILKTSKKEDIEKLLSNPQVEKLLGKDAQNLKSQLENINLSEINIDDLENKLK